MKWLKHKMTKYEKAIDELAKAERYQKRVNALICYHGIKNFFAMVMITEIGDINRFAQPNQLTSWLGFDIRECSSGGKHPNKVKVASARDMVGFVWESLRAVA